MQTIQNRSIFCFFSFPKRASCAVIGKLLRVGTVCLLVSFFAWGCAPSEQNEKAVPAVASISPLQQVQQDKNKGSEPITLLLGSYSQNGSEGLYTVDFTPESNTFGAVRLFAKTKNPSYAVVADQLVYAVNEISRGAVSAFAVSDMQQSQEALATLQVGGASPCYIALHPEGGYLATANYMGGSVSVIKLDHQGRFVGEPVVKAHSGKGAHKRRQEAPHAHWVQWQADGRAFYVVDLGTDAILRYPFSIDGSVGEGKVALRLAPGDGPRHMVFHPTLPVAFVLNELSNSLVVADVNSEGDMVERMRLKTLPEDFMNHSQAAHIALNESGSRVYVSNRGHDSIATFKVGSEGDIAFMAWEATKGVWPRHFVLLEDVSKLLVANQQHNNIVVFDIDAEGRLIETAAELKQPEVTFIGRLKANN